MKTLILFFCFFSAVTLTHAQTFSIESDIVQVTITGHVSPSVAASLVPAKTSSTIRAGTQTFKVEYAGQYTLTTGGRTQTFKTAELLRKALRALFKIHL